MSKVGPTTLVHTDTSNLASKHLTSLWIEIPANCVLECPMCFANTIPRENPAPQNIPNHVYDSIIREFCALNSGRKTIAIPGAGEPFHKFNRKLTFQIIKLTYNLGIPLTIFTTCHLMTKDDIDAISKEYNNVIILVKYNSSHKNIQESLVFKDVNNPSDPNYFDKRETVFKELIASGLNKPTTSDNFRLETRLGIVTSIMQQNINEIEQLHYQARSDNLIFDCDTILPRGRGAVFVKKRHKDSGQELDRKIRDMIARIQSNDKELYEIHWQSGGTYLGAKCTRFRNHLYIDADGKIHPCLGAFDVILGDISGSKYRRGLLRSVWESQELDVIKSHKYTGTCATCKNFIEENCFSCLGRATVKDEEERNLTAANLRKYGVVYTRGCLNYRPDILVLISQISNELNEVLHENSYGVTLIEKGQLESLWLPEQDPVKETTEEVRIWKDNYREQLVSAPWRWELNKKHLILPRLLGKSFLPIVTSLFNEDYDPNEMLLWVNLVIYDEIINDYFYRIIVREKDDEGTYDYRRTIFLSRWLEAYKDSYLNKILDVSNELKDPDTGKRFDYRIVFNESHYSYAQNKIGGGYLPKIYNLAEFIKEELIEQKIIAVREECNKIIEDVGDEFIEILMSKRLTPLEVIEIQENKIKVGIKTNTLKKIREKYNKVSELFLTQEDTQRIPTVPPELLSDCLLSKARKANNDENNEQVKNEIIYKLANYIIYINAMHKELAGYEVRHSYLHAESILKPSSALIIASRISRKEITVEKSLTPEQLPDELVAASQLMIQTILSPVIKVYENKTIKDNQFFTNMLLQFPHIVLQYTSLSIQDAIEYGRTTKNQVRSQGAFNNALYLSNMIHQIGNFISFLIKKEETKVFIHIKEELKKFVASAPFVSRYAKKCPGRDYFENVKAWKKYFKYEFKEIKIDRCRISKGAFLIILENLVNNSFEHGITENVGINTPRPVITLNLRNEDGNIIFTYKDRSFGYEAETFDKINLWMNGRDIKGKEGFGFYMISRAYKSIAGEGKNVKIKKSTKKNQYNRYWIDFEFKLLYSKEKVTFK